MVPLASVFAAVLLASASFATPVTVDSPFHSTSFTKRFNSTNLRGILQRDQARAQAFIASRKAAGAHKSQFEKEAVVSFPVTNEAVTYVAAVSVGSPATVFDLIIDTGSSNTWVGSGTRFKSTSTTKSTGLRFAVTYGSGSVSGNEVLDQVSLASGLVIPQQSIGTAARSSGFQGVDGILGIGPVALTSGTQSNNQLIPTVTDNLFSQGKITQNLVAVSFAPTTVDTVTNGELTFGGTDSSKFTGAITFTPITKTSPASLFWGIDQTISINGQTLLTSAGIVDTGTTLVLLASDAFTKYRSATGATLDANTGLVSFTSTQFNNLKPLNFIVNGVTFGLTANAQLWPRSLNTDIGGTAGQFLGIVNDLGSNSGQGLDFINGQTFLERFYSVYDTANKRVGFASTSQTGATSN